MPVSIKQVNREDSKNKIKFKKADNTSYTFLKENLYTEKATVTGGAFSLYASLCFTVKMFVLRTVREHDVRGRSAGVVHGRWCQFNDETSTSRKKSETGGNLQSGRTQVKALASARKPGLFCSFSGFFLGKASE